MKKTLTILLGLVLGLSLHARSDCVSEFTPAMSAAI